MNKTSAQYDPQFSHYMFSHITNNPGSAGYGNDIVANIIVRDQQQKFEGAPLNNNLNVSAPFKLFGKKHGAGVNIYTDQIGFQNDTYFQLSYAFKASVGNGDLGIGLAGGFFDHKLTAGENDWITIEGQDFVSVKDQAETATDFSAGLFYYTDELYLGLSSQHLLEPEIKTPGGTTNFRVARSYYLSAGYNVTLNNPAFELAPALLLSSDGTTSKVDVAARLIYNKKLYGGLGYRLGAAVFAMAGFEIMDNLIVGIAYDQGTNDFRELTTPSFEFMLNYSFSMSVEKTPKRYKSIRYL